MSKTSKSAPPAKKTAKKLPARPAPKKPEPPAEDDLYEQGDMATPERDPPYEDGL